MTSQTVICGECGRRVDFDDVEVSYNAEIDDVVFYCSKCMNAPRDDLYCGIHMCEYNLVDREDGSYYECPECKREDGETLGLR